MRRSSVGVATLQVLIALLTVVAVAGPSGAVTGGSYDYRQHPYVVALIYPGRFTTVCSGVYLSAPNGRRVVLTSAHCVLPAAGSYMKVYFGPHYTPSSYVRWGRAYRHWAYNPSTHAHDLAVIVFRHPPRWPTAVLPWIGRSTWHSSLTAVGFGDPYRNQRRNATERVTGHDNAWLYLRYGTGNTCSGDSGGPDIIPGTRQVAALASLGTCSWDQDTRTDTWDTRYLVNQVG